MTAYRVVEPSGSNGSIQFAVDGDFSSSPNLVFITNTEWMGIGTAYPNARLHVVGSTIFGSSSSDLHQFTGSAQFSSGLSGSLTRLVDGRSYLVAGTNVTITSESNGQVTISSSGGGGGSTSPCGVYWESTFPDSIATTGSVALGGGAVPSQLWVNGINLTPISGALVVPGSTLTDSILLNLSGALSGNQYGSFNIDVIGTTKGVTNILDLATAKWNLSVSMLQTSGSFQVVGVTELDTQRYRGPSSPDVPSLWDINFNTSGSLFVNTAGTPTDTAWGAIVTNQSIIDVETGGLYSDKSLISGSLISSCECCHDPYWISNNPNVIFTTGSVVIGAGGTTNELRVNGINLTQISGSAIIPGGTAVDYNVLSLSGTMSNNQYASFNIDVIGSTKGITNIANVSAAKRLVSISMVKAGGQFTVVGITEAEAQNYNGPGSVDNAQSWEINVDVSGSLYVNTNSTPSDTAWGVIVTKQSVIDVNSGVLLG